MASLPTPRGQPSGTTRVPGPRTVPPATTTAPPAAPPRIDPATVDLGSLFRDPKMFDSLSDWKRTGFNVIERDEDEIVMIAAHPSLPGYLFKKFRNKISAKRQLENYRLRAEGAAAVRKLVTDKQLQHIVVPQKWVRELPSIPGAHILLVEHIDVRTRSETKKAYPKIGEAVLRDLCVIVHAFRGLDSGARNMLLTKDGKIAFIDTERWKRERERSYLKSIEDYLTSEQRKLTKTIFEQLDRAQ